MGCRRIREWVEGAVPALQISWICGAEAVQIAHSEYSGPSRSDHRSGGDVFTSNKNGGSCGWPLEARRSSAGPAFAAFALIITGRKNSAFADVCHSQELTHALNPAQLFGLADQS